MNRFSVNNDVCLYVPHIKYSYDFRSLQMGHLDHVYDTLMVPFAYLYKPLSLYENEQSGYSPSKLYKRQLNRFWMTWHNFHSLCNTGSAVCMQIFIAANGLQKLTYCLSLKAGTILASITVHTPSSRTLLFTTFSFAKKLSITSFENVRMALLAFFPKASAFCSCMITHWISQFMQ